MTREKQCFSRGSRESERDLWEIKNNTYNYLLREFQERYADAFFPVIITD